MSYFIALLLAFPFFHILQMIPLFIWSRNYQYNNLLGVYGGIVADFLLQSFGLTSFLVLITIYLGV